MHPENDMLWSWDMQERLHKDLYPSLPKTKIMKTRVLKNIYLTRKNGSYQFQLEFMEQDLVIFSHTMDMAEFMNMNKMNIKNQDKDFKGRIVVPRIILKLSYNGMNRKELEIQSKIAVDFKSIFPQCKYVVLFFYQGIFKEDMEKSFRNVFDRIIFFIPGKAPAEHKYIKGKCNRRENGLSNEKYRRLVGYLKDLLLNEELSFME